MAAKIVRHRGKDLAKVMGTFGTLEEARAFLYKIVPPSKRAGTLWTAEGAPRLRETYSALPDRAYDSLIRYTFVQVDAEGKLIRKWSASTLASALGGIK